MSLEYGGREEMTPAETVAITAAAEAYVETCWRVYMGAWAAQRLSEEDRIAGVLSAAIAGVLGASQTRLLGQRHGAIPYATILGGAIGERMPVAPDELDEAAVVLAEAFASGLVQMARAKAQERLQ